MRLTMLTSDVYWVFWREIKRFLLQKARILVTVVQPLVWLVLMGNMMSGLTQNPYAAQMLGTSSYLQFMTPGVMIMTVLFGGTFSGTSVIWDRRLGMLNKMLAAPIHRAAIPLGKLLAIIVQCWFQLLVIVGIAMLLGVKFATGLPGILFMILLASLFGMVMGGISLSLSASLKSMEALFAIMNFLTMPLMFTSNAMFPIQAMPSWLQRIAAVNPLSFAVTPMRAVATQGWAWDTIWMSSLVLLLLASASIALAIFRFNRSIA